CCCLPVGSSGVTQCDLDVGVIGRLLHQLAVAGLAQELGGKVMPMIMKAEANDTGELAYPPPIALHAVVGQRITLPLDAARVWSCAVALTDIGEDELGML